MSNDEKNQMVVIRVPKKVLEAFDKTCPKGGRAEKLRNMMEKEASTSQGELTKSFDLEAKIAEKTQLLKNEWVQRSFLEKIMCRDRYSSRPKSAWDLLTDFFETLEDKKQREKLTLSIADYKDLRDKLLNFKLSGDQGFGNSERLIFINRLDYKIRRLTLEKEIGAYLQKQYVAANSPKEHIAESEAREEKIKEPIMPEANLTFAIDEEVIQPPETESDSEEEEEHQEVYDKEDTENDTENYDEEEYP